MNVAGVVILYNPELDVLDNIESYINQYPDFLSTLTPFHKPGPKHTIIKKMIRDSELANTGPMASVAGTISEFVVKNIIKNNQRVMMIGFGVGLSAAVTIVEW